MTPRSRLRLGQYRSSSFRPFSYSSRTFMASIASAWLISSVRFHCRASSKRAEAAACSAFAEARFSAAM